MCSTSFSARVARRAITGASPGADGMVYFGGPRGVTYLDGRLERTSEQPTQLGYDLIKVDGADEDDNPVSRLFSAAEATTLELSPRCLHHS